MLDRWGWVQDYTERLLVVSKTELELLVLSAIEAPLSCLRSHPRLGRQEIGCLLVDARCESGVTGLEGIGR